MERILLLMAAAEYTDAERAVQSALRSAARPERLSWGFVLREEPLEEELQAMAALGQAQFLCPAQDPWQAVEALWQGEGYILMAHQAMEFTRWWDVQLLRDLRRCRTGRTRKAALTGYLPRSADPIDALCPVAAESFDQDGLLHFHRGVSLRYARAAQGTAFVHPDFCFAPADFFREPAEENEPVFLRAYRRQWHLFTPNRPRIRLLWDEPVPPCDLRNYAGGRASGIPQFEQKAGLRFEKRQLSAMARQGLLSGEGRFPIHVPWPVRRQELLRRLLNRRQKVTPLCVTVNLTLPEPPPNLPEEYLGWFEHLVKIRQLALLCYADGENIRRASAVHPNVLEYKARYGLPGEADERDALNHLKLSKPFVLSASREKFLTHSHYVWMDYGCLRYPVYERAWLDWETVCTDRVVLASVQGQPDLSMFAVPEQLVMPLCREIAQRCERIRRDTGRLPKETALWTELIRDKPEWFDVRPMAGDRELLTLLMLPRGKEYNTKA